jgi:hypothetical protein
MGAATPVGLDAKIGVTYKPPAFDDDAAVKAASSQRWLAVPTLWVHRRPTLDWR